jgi:hypothetical protein
MPFLQKRLRKPRNILREINSKTVSDLVDLPIKHLDNNIGLRVRYLKTNQAKRFKSATSQQQ